MKKNKLFTLFSLTLLSMGTPLTSIAQVVAVSQDTPAITTVVNEETEKKQDPETKPVPTDKDKTGKAETEAKATEQEKADKKEAEPKAIEEPKKEARAESPENLENDGLTWGSASWSFDSNTGNLTINSGTLGQVGSAPWKRDDDKKIDADKIKKIHFTGATKAPKDSTYLFRKLTSLTEFENLTYLDTSEVTNMTGMFYDCYKLEKLDLSNFNTSNVTSMERMFFYGTNLESLDLSKFDTKNVADMTGLFFNCDKLKTLDLSGFNTIKKPIMTDMFHKTVLSRLTLGNDFRFIGDDSNLPNPAALNAGDPLTGKWIKENRGSYSQSPGGFLKYYGQDELTAGTYVAEIEAPLLWGDAPWIFDKDTGTLTIESGRLVNSKESPWKRDDDKKIDGTKIKKIVFTGPVLAPEDSDYLFKDLSNLTAFENLPYLDTSETTSMVDMFLNCTSLTTLDLSKFDTKNVTDMRGTFRGCTSIKSLDLSNLNTLNVKGMNKLFENVPLVSLTLGDNFKFIPIDISLSKPKSLLSTSELQREGKYLTGKWIKKDNQSAAYDTQKFMENYGKGDLTAGTYVAEIKSDHLWGDASWAFDHDTGILTISPGTLDKPENAPWKLADERKIDADKIKKIRFTGATKAPEDSTYLFRKLTSLTEFENLTYLDTSEVTNMTGMFYDCYDLEKLDLSNFNTSNVTSMERMFFYGASLESLDLSKFDTKNVKDMTGLFFNCGKLKTLDLSGFNTIKNPTMTDMFNGTVLSSLTLGNDFRFNGDDSNLPKPAALNAGDPLTGKWIKVNRGSYPQSPGGFMRQYGKNELTAGTYVAEIEAPLLWGDAPYTFDENTGTLTIESGRLVKSDTSPWKRDDEKKIDGTKIKKIVFTGPVLAPEDSTYLFRKLTSLTEIEGLTYLDTSEVTNMTGMFYDCYNLEKLDLSSFNTSNVTSMERMFFFCFNLESLDLSKFDTKNVTDMTGLFFNCGKLKTLDLSGFNTLNKPTMTDMFNGTVLSSLTLGNDFRFIGDDSNLPTPAALSAGDPLTGKWIKVNRGSYPQSPGGFMRQYGKNDLTAGTYVAEIEAPLLWGDAPYTFDENTGTLTIKSGRLVKSDQSPWKRDDDKKIDGTKIKKIIFTGPVLAPEESTYLFRKLTSLAEFENLTYLDTSEVTNMTGMFYDCYDLKQLDLSNFNTSNVTSMERMFFYCTNLESLDLSKFDTKNVTDMTGLFFNCDKLKTLDISGFNTIKKPIMTDMFDKTILSSLTLGNDFRFVGDDSNLPAPAALNTADELTGKWIKVNRGSYPQSPGGFMRQYGKNELTAGTYVAEIKAPLLWGDAPYTFDEDTGTLTIESGRLVKSNQSPWKRDDDKKIDGTKIKKIILTGPVLAPEDSKELFRKLTSLTEIENLTYLDTSEVTTMDKMFYDCYNLKKLDLSNFNTSNVTSIAYMFFYCVSLESLDLSKFDTKIVTDMSGLFQACKKLKTLDLSGFNTLSKPKMTDMFNDKILSSLTLGNDFRFETDANLPVPVAFTPGDFKRDGKYLTDKWTKKDNQSAAYDTQRFMTFYGKDDLIAGTYVAEIKPLLWGDAPLAFDSDTGLLTINSGTLGEFDTAPWELTDNGKIDADKIKKIRFTGATKAPENSEELFRGLNKLTEFENLTYLDTSEVTNMDKMFYDCYELKQLDLSNFNTSNVTSIERMFFYCVSLESLDLSKFNTKKMTDMTGLFQACQSLKTLDLSGFYAVRDIKMTDMFSDTILSSLTVGKYFSFIGGTDANLPVPTALTSGVELTGKWIKKNRGSYAYSPGDLMRNFSDYFLSAGTYVAEIKADRLWGDAPWTFDTNTGTLTIENGSLTKSNESPWNRQDDKKIDKRLIKKIIFRGPTKAPEDSTDLFGELTNLTEFEGLTYLDTKKVTNMTGMFYDCYALKKLDLSKFYTSNVKSISYMFFYCASLETLNLDQPDFYVDSVTDMVGVFNGCKALKSINLSRFYTTGITNMSGMFQDCASLTSLDVSKFSTMYTTNMTGMFKGCSSLTNLVVSRFNTRNVTDMTEMFEGCANMRTLDLSEFDTRNVSNMKDMFSGALITSIKLGKYFKFKTSDNGLNLTEPDAKKNGRYLTGKWMKKNVPGITYYRDDFFKEYGQGNLTPGTFIAETLALEWGDVPWRFDESTGTLTFKSGTLDERFNTSPWERPDGQDIDRYAIKKIVFTEALKAPSNSAYLFNPLRNLTEIVGLDKLDTSKATTMEGMFSEALSLTALDLSKFDTRKVTNMKHMFANVPLSSISLGNNFKFSGTDCGLFIPAKLPDGTPLSGKWIEKDGNSRPYLNKEFVEKYDYGNGEIKAGTYITEVYIGMSALETNLSFSTDSGKTDATSAMIGDQLQGKLTVKHAAGSAEDSTSIAVKLSTIRLLTDAWTLSPTVTVTTFDQTGKQTASKEQTIKDDALSLPVLPYGSYFEITLNGTAWEKAYAIPSGNCNYTLSYKNQAGDQKVDKSDNFVITSGVLGFKSVPNISFKDSVLPLASNLIIDRKDDDYALTVTDYRSAQLPSDDAQEKPDRVNWEITATASPFKDAAGKEIKLSTMAVSFTKAIGQTTELGADATLVTSHDVTGETAKQNNLTKLSWAKELGFKVVVHNRTDLDTTKYTADVAFDLRTAP